MRYLLVTVAVSLLLGFFSSSEAADNPNLLVMGEDIDKDTIPRNNRVFKRVVGALANQLHDQSFDVYDETAITLDNFEQGRSRRSDGELIDIANSIKRPPIDVVVIFSIYASAQKKDYTTMARARIEGRLLNVKTGQRLGNLEVQKEFNAPTDCTRECILETIGDQSRVLANDLGVQLTDKLAWMVDGGEEPGMNRDGSNDMLTDFYLVFDGFSAQEYMEIEEYLVIFSGYHSHRPIDQMHTRTEITYKSSISEAKLNRNLKKMMDELEMKASITGSGNSYTVKRNKMRGEKRKVNADDGW